MPNELVPKCVFCGDDTSDGGAFAFEGNGVTEQPILAGLCKLHWLRLYEKMRTEGWLPFHQFERTRLINFVPEGHPMTETDKAMSGNEINQLPTREDALKAAAVFGLSSKLSGDEDVAMRILDAYGTGGLVAIVEWKEDDDIPEGVDDWPVDSTIEGNLIMSSSDYDEFVEWLNGPGKTERLLRLFEMFRDLKNVGS